MNKKRRIYSRRGDLGETSLCFGPRVGKDHLRIVACGELDELNCRIAMACVEPLCPGVSVELRSIQHKIFEVSSEIASMTPAKHRVKMVAPEDIQQLEEKIDFWDNQLPSLDHFVLPGRCRSAAQIHLARSACRRAERTVVALVRKDESVSRQIIGWLNRLSDLLYTLARIEDQSHGQNEPQ